VKLDGFIGPSYSLPSPNVDAQRAVNVYAEAVQSGTGKERNQFYYRSTPGLRKILEVGDGPIRLVHVDSIGRTLVVSGDELYRVSRKEEWTLDIWSPFYDGQETSYTVAQGTDVNTSNDQITLLGTGSTYTGMAVWVSSTGTLPTGLSAETLYFVIVVDGTKIRLATSLANAFLNTYVDITATGTGNMTIAQKFFVKSVTGINLTEDIDYGTSSIPIEANTDLISLYTGQPVVVGTVGNPLPGGLTANTTYYIINGGPSGIQFATSVANANSGTEITLTEPADVTGDWYSDQIPSSQYNPGAGDATFSSATGPMSAASSSIGGEGRDSTTLFCDGTNNYILFDRDVQNGVVFENNASVENLLPAPIPSTHVVWIDGYFIVNETGTNRFYVSGLNDTAIDTLSFASSEGDPDIIAALAVNHRDLWVFNQKSTEVYVNTGNPDFPFERVQGGFIEKGCLAPYSVAKIDGILTWLGRDETGQGMVFSAKGLQPERISTHAVESAIKGYVAPEDGYAFTYQDNGHAFYVLSFAEATWVFDFSTGLWHERAYTNAGAFERHRANVHAFSARYQVHLAGDYEDERLYIMDDTYYSDDGDAITRMRTAPHISSGLRRVFHRSLQVDMEVGVGLSTGQGSDPQIMLDWSDDGGHTWSSESYASLGTNIGGIGEYKKRVIWRRLGQSRDRIYRVKVTDPVKVVFLGAELMAEEGSA
jgi:hypothetical protein